MGSPLVLRTAVADDRERLAELWSASLRPCEPGEALVDVDVVLERAAQAEDARLLVAEYDGEIAGAVLLEVGTVSPLNLAPMVRIISPTVVETFRRRGVGRALVEAGVAFAEELDVAQVGTASVSTSRDANRFMARLGLATRASWRLAPTATVRARINAMRPQMARPARPQLGQVLAARRSMRRATTSGQQAS